MTPNEYHQNLICNRENIFADDSYLSKSVLWELKTSSLYRWRFAPKVFTGSAAASWGSMVDAELTEPGGCESIVAVSPFDSFRSKDAREWRDEQAQAGLVVVKQSEVDQAKIAANKIRLDRNAADLLDCSEGQVILTSRIKDVNVKCMIDLVPEDRDYLVDIKTTGDFSPSGISKKIAQFGYHAQAAWYLKIWNNENPDDQRSRFRFIWQSSESPYEVAVTELPAMDIAAGEDWCAHQLERLTYAAKTESWGNIFNDRVAVIGRPGWADAQDEAEMEGFTNAPE